jgi:hypothetical protein
LAAGAVILVYRLARRAGLGPDDALFAALTTALSTLFLPLAPTFMTDLPAFFLLLACFHAFVSAAEAADRSPRDARRAAAWAAVGTLCGIAGGTIRQAVWFAPLSCAAVLAWRSSRGSAVRLAAAACGAVGLVALVVGQRWFAAQPYAIPTSLPTVAEVIGDDWRPYAGAALTIVAECVQKLLPVVLFCAPWFVARLRDGRDGLRRTTSPPLAIAMLAAGAVIMVALVVAGTVDGGWEGMLHLLGGGWRPDGRLWHDVGVGLIRAGVLGIVALAGAAVAIALGQSRSRDAAGLAEGWASGTCPNPALAMPLAYLVPYAASLLLVSRTTAGIYPRYYLPFLPALAVGLLLATRSAGETRPGKSGRSVLGWLLVVFFGLRAVAIVHDDFAENRARLAAIAHLQGQGVPRLQIASRWMIDAWEQIEARGYVNDSRIRVPSDAYQPDVARPYPDPKFHDKFPAFEPDYVLAVAAAGRDLAGERGSSPCFPFTSWRRPPYRREIVIRRAEP